MATYHNSPYSPQPPPLGTRQSSNADKYRPRAYSNPPPTQPNPTLLGPQQVPYVSPQMPPMASHNSYGFAGQAQEPRPEPGYPTVPDYGPPRDRDDYERRPSHSSQRSRHSHHSQVSQHSHRSHDSRRSKDSRRSHHSQHSHSGDRRDRNDDRERRHSRRSDEEYESETERRRRKQKKAEKEVRPTYGDSVMAVFNVLKSALGPRDKY